ncbi:hypothetical protein QUH73_00680 [Labilibaculum sp. K2S]|uniref:hypothetical protein n=1 Tax=Labilibaculum sp. K2S TaxID=3056386 RepID=UPI0025A3F829|nr:hypothetical protein [Labilibaculum sp. K2S]MDM8158317.1 hypothetical protein [Labilibaculum sp. K2S]
MKKFILFLLLVAAVTLLPAYHGFAAKPDKEITISWNSNWNVENLKISTNGDIEFNDNYTEITSISDGGYLKISMVSFGMKRKLYVNSDDGRVVYRYFEGNKEVDFEPKGREWMKKVLPDVIRNSGLDLENRVRKIYQKKGITGFLSELEQTDSDYYSSRMVEYLLKNNKLNKAELQSLLREFPYRIDSDYELSQIFKKYNPVFLEDAEVSAEFFRSLAELSSNYELSQVLSSVYKLNDLTNENFNLFIGAFDDISSDYEKSNLMKLALHDEKLTNEQLTVLLKEVEGLSSDYEKSQIIKSLLNADGLSTKNLNEIIELTHSLSSDYERTQIVGTMIKRGLLNRSNLDEFNELIEEISSEYSYTQILNELIGYEALGTDRFNYLIKASDNISSSYELSRFYNSLLNQEELSVEQQLQLISKAENISSNYELAQFLTRASQKMDLSNEKVYDALINATQEISSEYEYGKVMKAIYSHRKDR